jgi:hypothetical protein
MLAGSVHEDYAAERGVGATSAAVISGSFRRALDLTPSSITHDGSTRAVTVQTPSLYIDLRIAENRPVLPAGSTSFIGLGVDTLAALARTTHCFAGLSTVELVPPPAVAADTGSSPYPVALKPADVSMCSRRIGIDWQPPPRLKRNRWRIETRWESGGWVEWSSEQDAFGTVLLGSLLCCWHGLLGRRFRRVPPHSAPAVAVTTVRV